MAVNPSYTLKTTLYDQSSELGSFQANRPAIDDLDESLPTVLTAFITAIAGIVDFGATDLHRVSANSTRRVTNDKDGVGNREDKWLFLMQDTVTLAPYSAEIPMRSGGIATVPGTDMLPEATVATFRTQAEALFYSPDGNAGNLLQVMLIGRRS